jgi:hypothetical protein
MGIWPQICKCTINIVSDYLKQTNQIQLFKNGKPGKDWYYCFLKRWKNDLSLRKADNIASQRAASCTNGIIENYFVNCSKVFSEAKIDENQSSLFGMLMRLGFLEIKENPQYW